MPMAITMPQAGDPVRVTDYGYTPYLYHWTSEQNLEGICRQRHVACGTGENWGPQLAAGCLGKLFWSTQMDRWPQVIGRAAVLIRVPVKDVYAEYDGTEWVHTFEEDPEWIIPNRLSDATSLYPVPISLAEVILVPDVDEWVKRIDQLGQKLGVQPSSDAVGDWIPLLDFCGERLGWGE